MKNDQYIEIKDICEFIPGAQPPKSEFIHEEKAGYVRLIQIRDRLNDNFITFIPEQSTSKFVEPEEILIGRYGPPIFQVFRGFKGAYNVALMKAVPLNETDNDYLYYFLLQKAVLHYVESMSLRTAGQTGVQLDSLYKYPVLKLDKASQKKIAHVLKKLDEKISNNNAICSDIESISKLLYDYWFVQFDFPDKNGKPYKSSGGKMVWSEELKREIPEGWEVKPLIDCVSKEKNAIVDGPFGTQMKISEYVSEGIPVYEMDQLNGAFIVDKPKHFLTEKKYEEVKRSSVRNGDIVISKTGTLGLLGIVHSEYQKGIIVSRLAKITPDEKVIGKYALLIYLHELANNGYWQRVCGGSTMPILNNGAIGDVQIIIPNNDLYQRFETIVTPMYEEIYKAQTENQQLVSLRDFLLPMLMNGQVKVTNN